jgi:hypothetical protein
LVIRVSREPAENTSTSPLAVVLAEVVGLAGLVALEELDEELLQPAAVSPMQATKTSAPTCTPRR